MTEDSSFKEMLVEWYKLDPMQRDNFTHLMRENSRLRETVEGLHSEIKYHKSLQLYLGVIMFPLSIIVGALVGVLIVS